MAIKGSLHFTCKHRHCQGLYESTMVRNILLGVKCGRDITFCFRDPKDVIWRIDRKIGVGVLAVSQGHNHSWKVEGDQALGQKPRWVLGAGGVVPPPPGKFFENSDAKSCILVTTCCEMSCFLKTTAKKLGDQYIIVPQPKSWGTSLSRFLRLLLLYCRLTEEPTRCSAIAERPRCRVCYSFRQK